MSDTPQYSEKSVTVERQVVTYRVAGPETGTLPIVLVHGSAGNVDRHFGWIFPMMAFRRRVIALDMVDPGTDRLELDQLVAQVRAVIAEEVPTGPFALLGYSLGAAVAARTAAQLGVDRVKNLILIAGMMAADTHVKLRIRLWQRTLALDPAVTAEFMTLSAFSPHFMSTRTVEELAAGSAKLTISPFIEKQMDLNTRIDISGDCEQIRSRTLIVACSDDFMIPRRHQKMLFGAIEPSCYTEIPSGHGVVIERPAELFQHIDRFCKRPDLYPVGEIVYPQKP